jgi:hypothetical protein
MHLEYGFTPATLAHELRRFKRFHRLLQWLRRCLWRGLVEAFLELCRWIFEHSERFGPPLYAFSVYQALRTGDPKTNGRILLHDQGTPVVREGSLLVIGGYEQHKEQPWPVFWSEHRNARLASESLALMNGKLVCLESVYGFKRMRKDPAYRFFRLPPPVKLEGNWTSIISRWGPTSCNPPYTHWLLDALPRLALLSEFPADTRIIVPGTMSQSRKDSLALLGLLDRSRLTSETHLELEHYYFSPPTSMLQGWNPYGINFLRTAFLPKRDPNYSGPRKFFINRSGFTRTPRNAVELNDFFTSIGWALVDPANLTFAQQIKLFSEAEAICGATGSGLTNAVFCQPGCQLALLAQDFLPDSWLEWISQIVKADYHYLICPSSYRHTVELEIPRLKDFLRKLGHAA